MKLTKHIPLILLSVLSVFSCTERLDEPEVRETVEVRFRMPVEATKSVAEDERNVVTLDALAFRSDGRLDSYARQAGDEVTLTLTKGLALSWWVIANAPAGTLNAISNETTLESLRSLLSENASDALVMVGRGTGTYNNTTQSVTVSMTRVASKVSLGYITASFLGTGTMSSSTMTLDAVYLINACGSTRYDLIPVTEVWYNKMGVQAGLTSPVNGFLYRDMSGATMSAAKTAYGLVFYASPNPTDNAKNSSTDPAWSARNTRLVLETSIDGVKNYYPITLPAMRCNYEYAIEEVELLGFGSSSPDIPVIRESIKCSITVNPWGTEEKTFVME